mgnify:CR=1 FL=1
MKGIKFFIGCLFVWGAIVALMSCSNDTENLGMYSDEEFHSKVVQIQNKYNSSLKIDESCLSKDDETLTNINDIMRTIENSGFCYELITSEEGGLIAMPILSTTATRSNGSEANPGVYSEILSHENLPCDLEISGQGNYFQIKSCDSSCQLTNLSCRGSVSKDRTEVYGDIEIRFDGNYRRYEIYRVKNHSSDILWVTIK